MVALTDVQSPNIESLPPFPRPPFQQDQRGDSPVNGDSSAQALCQRSRGLPRRPTVACLCSISLCVGVEGGRRRRVGVASVPRSSPLLALLRRHGPVARPHTSRVRHRCLTCLGGSGSRVPALGWVRLCSSWQGCGCCHLICGKSCRSSVTPQRGPR